MFSHDTQEEILTVRYKNKHHEKLEKTKKYKTVEFDLIPVLFEEEYEKTENYKKCNDSVPEFWPTSKIYQTNISKYYNRPDLTSLFVHYNDFENDEIIKIIRELKEILYDVLYLKSYGFIELITFKNYHDNHCIFNCKVKVSEDYFSKEAEFDTENNLVCKELCERGYKVENFSDYFNYINEYICCLLEIVFGYCSSEILFGGCSDSIYSIIYGTRKAYDQIRYMKSMILIEKHEKHIENFKNGINHVYLVLKKLGFIFKKTDEKI